MAEHSVEMRGVVKYHGTMLAVDHVSLEVRRGEFFSVLGPSGAGKTTLLRLLAGFEHPDEGAISIDGRSMAEVPPNLRPVNLVFQSYALFPHLTVFGNVAFGLEMHRVGRAEIVSRVHAALDMVKLTGKAQRYPSELSGGEQQRVAVARALVNRPSVVLLDEPLAALDLPLRQEMQMELKAIQQQVGISFMCVTHHQEEALTMSDRIAVMDSGRILQVGTPREIYDSPVSSFVANFIGVSNTVTGLVRTVQRAECSIEISGLPPIVARCPQRIAAGSRVTVLVRPERLILSREAPGVGVNALPARVMQALYSGKETVYLLRLTEKLTWKARLSSSEAERERFQVGEEICVAWDPQEALVLNE